jgi:peptidase E
MKQIIYGIGGGDMRNERMEMHYRRIADLARDQFDCDNPKVTILPTAHHNGTNKKIGTGWMDLIVEKFEALGCETDHIWVGNQLPDQQENTNDEVKELLAGSHAVFVLGGDSEYLLEVVRERKLESAFKQAISDGKIMCGTSAGLIWLSSHCMSDSESFHKDDWNYMMLEGLGVLPLAINVHDNGAVPEGIIDTRSRLLQFEERFLELKRIPGLVVDEMVGVEVTDGLCVVKSPAPDTGASCIVEKNGEVVRRKMTADSNVNLFDPNQIEKFVLKSE